MSQRAFSGYLPHRGTLLCVVIGLVLSNLMHHATLIELDEVGSWGISRGGALEALKTCILAQGQGPLYFILLSFWIQVFGDSVFALRSLSMVTFAGALLCLAHGFAKLRISNGVISGALLVSLFSWCSLNYSFIARPYALATFFVAAGVCFSVYPKLTRPRKLMLAVIGAATFFTHYFFVAPLLVASSLVTGYLGVNAAKDVVGIKPEGSSELQLSLANSITSSLSVIFKERILPVLAWEIGGVIVAIAIIAPFFIGHLGSVSDLRYLTLPVPELLIPALQSFPLAPIGLIPPLYLLLKKSWSIHDAYSLGLFELIFSIGLILGLYVASHLLESTFFVPRYFGIALPILLILSVKVGNQLIAQKSLLVSFVFSFQIFWSLFGPPNLAEPLEKGLLNIASFYSNPDDYRTALNGDLNLDGRASFARDSSTDAYKTSPRGVDKSEREPIDGPLSAHKVNRAPQRDLAQLYKAQYERNVKAPEKFSNCAVFISSGFIESVSSDRMHNELLQPFLRSPIEYFFRGDFELLPKHFFHHKVAPEYVSKIKQKVYQTGCALLVPARDQGFSTQLWQSLESIPPSLRETDLIVEPYTEWLDSLLVRAPM